MNNEDNNQNGKPSLEQMQKAPKKLLLKKEMIRHLTPAELEQVYGGDCKSITGGGSAGGSAVSVSSH